MNDKPHLVVWHRSRDAEAVLLGPDGVAAQGRGAREPRVVIDLLAGKR